MEEILADDATANLLAGQFLGDIDDDQAETAGAAAVAPDALAWVREAPETHAPRLASHIPFAWRKSDGGVSWTPIAAALIDMPDVAELVLERFEQRFGAGSWSGSSANRFIRRRGLLAALL